MTNLLEQLTELEKEITPGEWERGPGTANDYLIGTPRTKQSSRWETATLNHYRFERLIAIIHNVPPSINGLANGAFIVTVRNNLPQIKQALAGIEACIQAVNDEPELPGEMPDEMWEAIRGNREDVTAALRIAVRETKLGIIERIRALKSMSENKEP